MGRPKRINWSRVLDSPPRSPDDLARLTARTMEWETMGHLCAVTGDVFEPFNPALMEQVRDFLSLIRMQQWEEASQKYQMVQQVRAEIKNGILET